MALEPVSRGGEPSRDAMSAFGAAAAEAWPPPSPGSSEPASICTSRAHSGLPDGLPAPQIDRKKSLSLSRANSGAFGRRASGPPPELCSGVLALDTQRSQPLQSKRSLGLLRVTSDPTSQLWRTSTAVTGRAASLGLQSVRDMCGPSYICTDRLRKPKALGEGAFAVVELAQLLPATEDSVSAGAGSASSAQPLTVAVKRLKPHVLESEDDVISFIQEARLLVRLRHPSIIQFIGLGTSDTSSPEASWRTMFLVQEYAEGGTLKRMVFNQMINPTRKLYSLADAVRWATQVAEGLAYLHSMNPMILHRDLKSENVLLTKGEDGRIQAKLADFGLHKLVRRPGARTQWTFSDIKEEPRSPNSSQHGAMDALAALHLTVNASVVRQQSGGTGAISEEDAKYELTGRTGAFVYMAPEVLLGQQYNEKVDVFSLGMVLYELLHRKMVVADLMYLGSMDDAEAFAYQVAAGYRLPISDDVPEVLGKLVSECLSGKPELRPSMAEVVSRLKDAAASGELEAAEHMHGPRGAAGCCTVM